MKSSLFMSSLWR